MTRLTQLDVSGNADMTSPPPETVKNGTAAIVGFMHDLIADSRPSYRMKLMIVGQENVGKTTLLRVRRARVQCVQLFCLRARRVQAINTKKSAMTLLKVGQRSLVLALATEIMLHRSARLRICQRTASTLSSGSAR